MSYYGTRGDEKVAKKKGGGQPRNYRKAQDSGNSTTMFIVVIIVLLMGLGTLYAIGGGSAGGGVNTSGGQSISSLESQVKSLTEQVNANPKNATLQEDLGTALFNLANAFKESNDQRANETFNKTIQAYNEALKLKPNSKETLGDLATAYFYTNQVDQAISTVEKALKIDPNFVPALMNYGIYLANGKGDYENAIKQWQKVPSGAPQYSQAQSLIQQYKK